MKKRNKKTGGMGIMISCMILCFFIFPFFSFASVALPQDRITEKVMVTEGMARGVGLQAQQEAVNRALRSAIEQGVGTLVDSETLTQNFRVLDDRVYTQVKGYVKSYEILSEQQTPDGLYVVQVKATVALGLLEKDLKALNILKARKKNPKIMVLCNDYIHGEPETSHIVSQEIEKIFLEKQFSVVDKTQMDTIKEKDEKAFQNDIPKAAQLAQRFGAEIVITGEGNSELAEQSTPYGVSVFAYSATITLKAINTDTAKVIATESSSAIERGAGKIPTAQNALKSAGRKAAASLLATIVEAWRSETFNTVEVEIVIDKVTPDNRRHLISILENMPGVESVLERSYADEVLICDIVVSGSIWSDFDRRLESLSHIQLLVTNKTQNRIDLAIGSPESVEEPEPLSAGRKTGQAFIPREE